MKSDAVFLEIIVYFEIKFHGSSYSYKIAMIFSWIHFNFDVSRSLDNCEIIKKIIYKIVNKVINKVLNEIIDKVVIKLIFIAQNNY